MVNWLVASNSLPVIVTRSLDFLVPTHFSICNLKTFNIDLLHTR